MLYIVFSTLLFLPYIYPVDHAIVHILNGEYHLRRGNWFLNGEKKVLNFTMVCCAPKAMVPKWIYSISVILKFHGG